MTDTSGATTDTYLYDAWGNELTVTGTSTNPFRWVGRLGYYYDQASGVFYVRARAFDPTTGRWMSADPLFFPIANPYRYSPGTSGPNVVLPCCLIRRQNVGACWDLCSGLNYHAARRLLSLHPSVYGADRNVSLYEYVGGMPTATADPSGLGDYSEKQNKDGSSTITISDDCVIVILFGHGCCDKPHTFKFTKPCQAAGFVGCDAGATNEGIPKGNQIPGLKMTNGIISTGPIGLADPKQSQAYWLEEAKKGAKEKAKEFCKKCGCKQVKIYGEAAGATLVGGIANFFTQPSEFEETVDCTKANAGGGTEVP